MLVPTITVISMVGVYSVHSTVFDLVLMVGLGVFGYLLRKLNFPLSALILGFVLGEMMEDNLRRALSISNGEQGPITLALWALTVAMLAMPGLRWYLKRRRGNAVEAQADMHQRLPARWATPLIGAFGGWLASTANWPLPWMVGSLLAVIAVRCSGWLVSEVPRGRQVGQWIVASAIGLHFTGEVMREVLAHFGVILAGAVGTLLLGLIGIFILLRSGSDRPPRSSPACRVAPARWWCWPTGTSRGGQRGGGAQPAPAAGGADRAGAVHLGPDRRRRRPRELAWLADAAAGRWPAGAALEASRPAPTLDARPADRLRAGQRGVRPASACRAGPARSASG